jgi:small multidrug resistance family-3 protein
VVLPELKTVALFVLTALAEIVGCYLPYLWLREGKTIWLLIPSVLSLIAFVWLLTLHPTAVGRVYAAYGVYCNGDSVAMGSQWHSAKSMGYRGFGRGALRYGDYHVCAT